MIEIPLSRGLVALVDDVDAARVLEVGKWYADANARTHYARKNYWVDGHCRSIKMHSLITGWDYVDHINGNGLDNRRCNLRQATGFQNAQNRGMRSDNSSGYKGVSYHRASGRYAASVQVNGRRLWLGLHATPREAALAYDAAAVEHFGPFARLNFPKEIAS